MRSSLALRANRHFADLLAKMVSWWAASNLPIFFSVAGERALLVAE
ncbi:MAG: hypothetical protein U0793_17850 [Gemmataceae bacterium]